MSPDDVCAYVCLPPVMLEPRQRRSDLGLDYLRRGVERLGDFMGERAVEHCVQRCRSTADVEDAARMVYMQVAQAVNPERVFGSERAQLEWAEGFIARSFEAYVDLLVRWHALDPWSVVFARMGGRRVGVSIVLPIEGTLVNELLAGRLDSIDCIGSVRSRPTATLMLEACAEDLGARGRGINPTRGLLLCLLLQLGAVSRCHLFDRQQELRMIAVSGTPDNRERLVDHGFEPTGVHMPSSGVELMLRQDGLGISAFKRWAENAILLWAGRSMPEEPPD